jgi:ABC-type branched-subunit amino acid transport system ATPase component
MADYGYVLETGSITREGPARELLKDEEVRWDRKFLRVSF